MTNFFLTCCSTADMSCSFFETNKIPFACFHYLIDGVEYPDDLGQTVPFSEFYRLIEAGAMPTTSQVNEQSYIEMWTPILKSGGDILHITLSSGLSGTINSANVARDTMAEEYPDRRVVVIDSLGASGGYGLLVSEACRLRDEGKSLDEAVAWVEENKLNVHHWFFSTDLTSYYRGGRISRAAAWFGTALKICPLLNMDNNGALIPREKIRGKAKVIKTIVACMEQNAHDGLDYSGKCIITNSACLEDAQTVAALIEGKFPKLKEKVIINSVGTVIGSHTGPGTVALFFLGNKRVD